MTITSNNPSFLVWDYKTNLTPPHFIEVPVQNQERDRSLIVLGLHFVSFYDFLLLDSGTDSTVWYFLCVFYFFILFPYKCETAKQREVIVDLIHVKK